VGIRVIGNEFVFADLFVVAGDGIFLLVLIFFFLVPTLCVGMFFGRSAVGEEKMQVEPRMAASAKSSVEFGICIFGMATVKICLDAGDAERRALSVVRPALTKGFCCFAGSCQ